MSNITISNLHPVGSTLLSDSESFMNDLSDMEGLSVQGGSSPVCVTVGLAGFTFGVGTSIIITVYEKSQEGEAV